MNNLRMTHTQITEVVENHLSAKEAREVADLVIKEIQRRRSRRPANHVLYEPLNDKIWIHLLRGTLEDAEGESLTTQVLVNRLGEECAEEYSCKKSSTLVRYGYTSYLYINVVEEKKRKKRREKLKKEGEREKKNMIRDFKNLSKEEQKKAGKRLLEEMGIFIEDEYYPKLSREDTF